MAKIMIVDDAEFIRMIIKDILLKNGHEVVAEGTDGEEAIEKYKEYKPEIVILDIVMPKMEGIEALQKILEIDPEAKVAMCSSIGQQSVVKEALKIGARDFIVKPFEADSVLEVIEKIL